MAVPLRLRLACTGRCGRVIVPLLGMGVKDIERFAAGRLSTQEGNAAVIHPAITALKDE